MRSLVAAASCVSALALVGCMGDEDGAMTTTVRETVTGTVSNQAPTVLAVYFLRDGKVAPVARSVSGKAVGTAALRELLEGPGADESVETAIPRDTALESLTIDGGVARVELSKTPAQDDAVAQIVYTLTQFPTVRRVDIGSDIKLRRARFENETPAILVESPLPGDAVEPGFEARGTANTFEATFNYELRDSSDQVVAKDFVTATSGSGTRGTFRFTVDYEVPSPRDGRLVVFEISAEDGSRTHESSIPLALR
jgi:germination protein M